MKLTYKIKNTETFNNIKEVIKTQFKVSDRLLLKLKNSNKILLNNIPTNVKAPVNPGDTIKILIDFEEDNSNIVPTKIDLNILYEDDAFLIINKPAGLPIHPSMLHFEDSLSNGVKYYFDCIHLKKKIRPVNRLDKDTSGIVIFAKNEYIQECLIKQMKDNTFIKEYIAICDGKFKNSSGTINLPISRKPGSIIERCVDSSGDIAITHYDILYSSPSLSVAHLVLETGRTHQIRVHLSSIGNGIIGDSLYWKNSDLIDRQALHSYKVSFVHPITRKNFELTAPLYDDMKKIIIDNFETFWDGVKMFQIK